MAIVTTLNPYVSVNGVSMGEACIAAWQERLRRKAESGTLLCGGNAEKSFRENWAAMLSALPTPSADGNAP